MDDVRCAVGEADTAATAAAAADNSADDAVVFPGEVPVLPLEVPLLNVGRSWGAGDGAIVMAVLIVGG